jgi:hypothetical protein
MTQFILKVRARFQDQPVKIAAQRGVGPDIAVGTDDHVADQDRGGMT